MAESQGSASAPAAASSQGAPTAKAAPSKNTSASLSQSTPANGKSAGVVAFAQKANAPAKESKAQEPSAAESEWGEEQDNQLFELMKKSPHFRFKAGGKEQAIDSKEAWEKARRNIERVAGINPLIEKTNQEKQAMQAELAKYKALEAKLEAARRGDDEALRSLGVRPRQELDEINEALSALPPEVRQLWEENQALQAKEQERVAALQKEQQEREQKEAVAAMKQRIAAMLQKVGYNSEEPDPEALLDAAARVRQMMEIGGEYGRDYDDEDVSEYIRESTVNRSVAKLMKIPAKTRGEHIAKLMGGRFDVASALETLGEETVISFGKELAKHLRERQQVDPLKPRPSVVSELAGQQKAPQKQSEPEVIRRKFY